VTNDVFILDAVRTPVGKYGGALAGVRPDDLAATAVRALVERSPELDPAVIDDVWLGDANGAGEDNRDVARMAVLLAGLPPSVPGVTLNRLCGSGLEAAIGASRAIAVGDASLAVAGGVESMSRAPWVLPKPERGYPRGHETLSSTTLGWRMVNPAMPQRWTVALGEGAEILAERYRIGREEQDAFALRSHAAAAAAWADGRFDREVVGVPGADLARDETIRPDTTLEQLAGLKPVFRPDGSVTAGNSSPLNDGAAALLLGDEAGASAAGRTPLARIVSRAVSGVEPHLFGIGPVEAARTALLRRAVAGLPGRVAGPRPAAGQPAGRRDRDRPPAGRLRGENPGQPGPPAARPRWRVRAGRHLHRRRPGAGRRPARLTDARSGTTTGTTA
jgi:acetyl-CoA acetyltransferase family protein